MGILISFGLHSSGSQTCRKQQVTVQLLTLLV